MRWAADLTLGLAGGGVDLEGLGAGLGLFVNLVPLAVALAVLKAFLRELQGCILRATVEQAIELKKGRNKEKKLRPGKLEMIN